MGLIYVPLFSMMVFGAMSETTVNVHGVQGTDVLLPCPCAGRHETKELKWCIDEKPVLLYPLHPEGDYDSTRVKTFWNKNSSDCSILLKNITNEDQQTYRCSFYKESAYNYHFVILEVIPPPTPPPTSPPTSPSTLPPTPDAQNLDAPEGKVESPSKKHFVIIPIIAFLLVMGCLYNTYLKQRRNRLVQQTQEEATDSSGCKTKPEVV